MCKHKMNQNKNKRSLMPCHKKWILFHIIICFGIIMGCTSTKPDPSSDDTMKEKSPAMMHHKTLAPGTVEITAKPIRYTENERRYHCTIQIETIHGYGSATPVLSAGKTLEASLSKSYLQKQNRHIEDLHNSQTLRLILSVHEAKAMGSASVRWEIIQFFQ